MLGACAVAIGDRWAAGEIYGFALALIDRVTYCSRDTAGGQQLELCVRVAPIGILRHVLLKAFMIPWSESLKIRLKSI